MLAVTPNPLDSHPILQLSEHIFVEGRVSLGGGTGALLRCRILREKNELHLYRRSIRPKTTMVDTKQTARAGSTQKARRRCQRLIATESQKQEKKKTYQKTSVAQPWRRTQLSPSGSAAGHAFAVSLMYQCKKLVMRHHAVRCLFALRNRSTCSEIFCTLLPQRASASS